MLGLTGEMQVCRLGHMDLGASADCWHCPGHEAHMWGSLVWHLSPQP